MTNPMEPAFPGEYVEVDDGNGQSKMTYAKGMTKREYFAALAMQAFLFRAADYTMTKDMVLRSLVVADQLIEELSK